MGKQLNEYDAAALRIAAQRMNWVAQNYGLKSAEYAQAQAQYKALCRKLGV